MPLPSLARAFTVIAFFSMAGKILAFPEATPLPTLKQALQSKTDLYGALSMQQTNGPSYEFFEGILPPPRYVNADFRYYPIVLSAPAGTVKARLVSNGSGVNLRAGSRSWKEVGHPVTFRVGSDEFLFGGLADRVSRPQWLEGWMPLVSIDYQHPSPFQSEGAVPIDQKATPRQSEVYRLEAFADATPQGAERGLVHVRFSLQAGTQGKIAVHADSFGPISFLGGRLKGGDNQTLVLADSKWTLQRGMIHASLKKGDTATIAIPTKPLKDDPVVFDNASFTTQLQSTLVIWKGIIARSTQVEVPEARVNHAWKNLLVQNYMLMHGEKMFYSAGNQYEQLYCGEGGDAALAMLAWNHETVAKKLLEPILDFSRKGLEHHQAGLKLQDVARVWSQTRDREWALAMQPRWEKELRKILDHRNPQNGLLPKERYCGDISTPVHSLSVDAKAWRALRDIQPMLKALNQEQLLAQVVKADGEYRQNLLAAVRKSIRTDTDPPFIPIALLDNEQSHSPITATRIGSYWNIINGFVLASRIFPHGSPEENYLAKYIENHGGLFMGMTRSGGTAHAFWSGPERVNPLYGMRYSLDLLRRDRPEEFLVGFYGMLAQGFARDTFIGAEGCTLDPVDERGRFFYCPPNSAANGHFLSMLRNLLVQETDEDDDGEPEILRLGFATPKRWLEDGKRIDVKNAPTAFGPVSFNLDSQLSNNRVLTRVDLPKRNPAAKVWLRTRLPQGWKVQGATIAGKAIPIHPEGTVDLSQYQGSITVEFQTVK